MSPSFPWEPELAGAGGGGDSGGQLQWSGGLDCFKCFQHQILFLFYVPKCQWLRQTAERDLQGITQKPWGSFWGGGGTVQNSTLPEISTCTSHLPLPFLLKVSGEEVLF